MATQLLLIVVLTASLLSRGDRTAASWEAGYNRAIQWYNRAEFEEARAAAESGYRACGQRQSRACWQFRLALAESLTELNLPEKALPLLAMGAPSAEDEARRLSDLALAYHRSGDDDLSLQYVEKARNSVPPNAHEISAKIDLIRGSLQLNKEQFSDAQESFRRALTAVEGSHSLIESYTFNNFGVLDLTLFRYDEALYWFGRERDSARSNGMQRPLELTLGNLGVAFLDLGDFERAVKNLGDAVALAEKIHDRVYQMRWLVLLGETWFESGELTKAAECYRNARLLANPERDRAWLAGVFDDSSRIALKKGDLASAEDLNRQGAALAGRLGGARHLLPHNIEAADIAAARGEYRNARNLYSDALAASRHLGDPVAAFRCHAGLASVYRGTGDNLNAKREYRTAVSLSDDERAKLQADDSRVSFLSRLIEFYRDYVDFLVDRGDDGEAFRVAQSCRARVLEEKLHRDGKAGPAADLKSIERESKASGAILLSYWLGPKRSLLWVIDPKGGLHKSFALPPEEKIATQIRRYNDAIQDGANPIEAGNEAGKWLFANLLGRRVPEDGNVVIEADGVLHQLNFESLPSEDGKYWIEHATVSMAPSLDLLRSFENPPLGRLLVFGDPKFDGTEFRPLPNVKTELAAVERHFPESQRRVYVSGEATPEAYGHCHPDEYAILHFATHGVANWDSPLDSAIVLAGSPDKRKLYAREILQQPLKADLVTLSACQTAGSRTYFGEGLTGFAWAFLSAGARNVVAGLGNVDDHATADLMGYFYDGLASGMAPARALRQAKRDLMASKPAYRRPLYWAAFETFTRGLYR